MDLAFFDETHIPPSLERLYKKSLYIIAFNYLEFTTKYLITVQKILFVSSYHMKTVYNGSKSQIFTNLAAKLQSLPRDLDKS